MDCSDACAEDMPVALRATACWGQHGRAPCCTAKRRGCGAVAPHPRMALWRCGRRRPQIFGWLRRHCGAVRAAVLDARNGGVLRYSDSDVVMGLRLGRAADDTGGPGSAGTAARDGGPSPRAARALRVRARAGTPSLASRWLARSVLPSRHGQHWTADSDNQSGLWRYVISSCNIHWAMTPQRHRASALADNALGYDAPGCGPYGHGAKDSTAPSPP